MKKKHNPNLLSDSPVVEIGRVKLSIQKLQVGHSLLQCSNPTRWALALEKIGGLQWWTNDPYLNMCVYVNTK